MGEEHRGTTRGEGWIILRTAGRSTLRLAETLAEDGYECWTPRVTRRITVPRMNAKRDVTFALLPGFVFAAARHLWPLVSLSQEPGRGLSFTVFRHLDEYRAIPDHHLEGLRTEERKSVTLEQAVAYAKGEEVMVLPIAEGVAGVFGGMVGVVLRSNPKKTQVLFDGRRRAEFFTFDLKPIQVISPAQVARAA